MKDARLELRVDPEFLKAIDDARGDVSRTRWVERAVEAALGGVPVRNSVRVPRVSEDLPRGAGHLPTCRCPVCKPK